MSGHQVLIITQKYVNMSVMMPTILCVCVGMTLGKQEATS